MNQLSIRKRNELATKKKKGFTLIELIIVIAIIAVLAAIAIPKFGKVKADANMRADEANAKIIATAVAHAVSNGDTITDGDVDNTDNFVAYIDGGKAPIPKTTGATKFSITYTEAKGTVVTMNTSTPKVLYGQS